jgi:REP element-mobilizing transposase RayT
MAEQQQSFELRTWGGRRRGAGRPAARTEPALPHGKREEVRPYQPVHVTLRFADHVWNLRSERSYAVLHGAFEAARRRPDVRIVHFGIQGNHLHAIVEAEGTRALSNAVRATSIRIARGLNEMMGRSGPVFSDRFHAHVLRTPAEVRNAARYVEGNFASHARRRGERVPEGYEDRFSSAVARGPRSAQGELFVEPVTEAARTWLLRNLEVTRGDRRCAPREEAPHPTASAPRTRSGRSGPTPAA